MTAGGNRTCEVSANVDGVKVGRLERSDSGKSCRLNLKDSLEDRVSDRRERKER